ncbi:MAG: radical SAM protein [Candidatus Omnitrophota bacterium]
MSEKYKYVYGPVSSWRLGSSLGVDLISKEEKVCTFDCSYCQIGPTKDFSDSRKIFVPTKEVLKEINSISAGNFKIDYITFSGRGEPTLAANLGDVIEGVKKIRNEKVAVITNSSLIDSPDVQDDLSMADLVMVKIDACSEDLFLKINKPMKKIKLSNVLEGIEEFRRGFKGKLALQIMFTEANKDHAEELAKVAKKIKAHEIQINTPLRPSNIKPLSKKDIQAIKKYFKGMNIVTAYDAERKNVMPVSKKETLKRRGKRLK